MTIATVRNEIKQQYNNKKKMNKYLVYGHFDRCRWCIQTLTIYSESNNVGDICFFFVLLLYLLKQLFFLPIDSSLFDALSFCFFICILNQYARCEEKKDFSIPTQKKRSINIYFICNGFV